MGGAVGAYRPATPGHEQTTQIARFCRRRTQLGAAAAVPGARNPGMGRSPLVSGSIPAHHVPQDAAAAARPRGDTMMTTACQWWTDDDQLIAALSDALSQARAVPREFIKIGKGCIQAPHH